MRYRCDGKDTTKGSCVWVPKWVPLYQFTVHRRRQQGIDVKQVSRTPMQVICLPLNIGDHLSFQIYRVDVGAKARKRQESQADEELRWKGTQTRKKRLIP